MVVTENLETEEVREENDTVFIIIREFLFDDTDDMIETAYHNISDARAYVSNHFGSNESAIIREQVVK